MIAREARVSGQAYYDICCNVCTIAKLRENGYVHRYDCNETVRTLIGSGIGITLLNCGSTLQ